MLLAIDVGNTTTALGLYAGEQRRERFRLQTVAGQTADELHVHVRGLLSLAGLAPRDILGCALSCVVPPMLPTWVSLCHKAFGLEPLCVGPGVKTGMPVLCENPREVGADRIVTAVAAYERYQRGLIVVDFGTATAFDAISPRGEYLGGAICPGLSIGMEALSRSAAKLPRVEFKRPARVVGRDTVSCMQSGLVYGTEALVDGMCKRMAAELGYEVWVVATGELAPLLQGSQAIQAVDEDLTLDGLRILYDRNRPQERPARENA
jgi:type III pantothenate kinase